MQFDIGFLYFFIKVSAQVCEGSVKLCIVVANANDDLFTCKFIGWQANLHMCPIFAPMWQVRDPSSHETSYCIEWSL